MPERRAPQRDLAVVDSPQLRHESLVQPDGCQTSHGGAVGDRLIPGPLRCDPTFEPEPQPVETPRRRPTEDWTNEIAVDALPETAPPRPIVVAGDEAHTVDRRNVSPITGAGRDDRPAIVSPELQPRPSSAIRPVTVAQRLARPGNRQPRCDARGIGEPLRLVTDSRLIPDRTEPDIPPSVLIGVLGRSPQLLDRGSNTRLHIDRAPSSHPPHRNHTAQRATRSAQPQPTPDDGRPSPRPKPCTLQRQPAPTASDALLPPESRRSRIRGLAFATRGYRTVEPRAFGAPERVAIVAPERAFGAHGASGLHVVG